MKSLALLKGGEITGPTELPKWVGQLRHLLSFVGGILISMGVIGISGENFESALTMLWAVVEQVPTIVGLVMTFVAFVSSWFAKEKEIVADAPIDAQMFK